MMNRFSLKRIVMTVAFLSVASFADNPIIQTNYTADPAPLVFHDTVFLYTSHDEDDAQGFKMLNWMLYSSTDMVNWTDHGIIASLQSFSWENGSAWAPQCVYRNGKFYLYCPLNRRGGNISIGVLVADSPYGPFSDPLGEPLITDSEGANDYDPTAFIDDDGRAYTYWGGNGPCMWAELNEDMVSLAGGVHRAEIDFTGTPSEASFTEGPWQFKRNNIYYLAWASRCCPEGIGYAMSNSPTGPWTCKGLIMWPNERSSGNHPGIIEFKGKWYVFGFDYELLFTRIPYSTSKPERRSICVKEMNFNEDGTIEEVPWWGAGAPLPGVEQVGTFNPYDTIQAETICWSYGVRTKVCDEGGLHVDSIHDGDFIKVKGVDFGSDSADSADQFMARVASGSGSGTLEIHLDTTTGPLIGTIDVSGTGGWQNWETDSCDVSGANGVHDVYFTFKGGSGLLFNFNWWRFRPVIPVGTKRSFAVAPPEMVRPVISYDPLQQRVAVDYAMQRPGMVKISLYDQHGRTVAVIDNGKRSAGYTRAVWNAEKLSGGIYIWKMVVDGRDRASGNVIAY